MDRGKDDKSHPPRGELSLESATRILSSIIDEPVQSVIERAKTYGTYITALERRAFEKVGRSIVKNKDRTDSFAGEKVDGEDRITLRMGVDMGQPMDIAILQAKVDGQETSQFTLPLSERLILSSEVDYFDREHSVHVPMNAEISRSQMLTLVTATKLLANNLIHWNDPRIISNDVAALA